ncbi:MAG: DUF5916 domain-containing protein [Blastocatellales bacterium]
MTFTHLIFLCAIIAIIHSTAAAQPAANSIQGLRIPKVNRAPALEDFLGMKPGPEIEGDLAKADNFIQNQPRDGEPATQRTEAYLCYDDKNLYIIFVAFDNEPEKIRARMEKRENAFDDDFVEVTLDTFHDRRRGYMFWSNPLGVQADGIWTEEQGDPDWSFDTIWQTRGQRTKEGYVVWMAIPFKSLRFRVEDQQTWNITLLRMIPRANEWAYWPRVSARVEGRLSQAGEVTGLNRISPGRSIFLIPYGSFRSFRALDTNGSQPQFIRDRQFDGGLDAKIVLKDNFVLDVTANPDFAQVESDQPQVTVNQRFEVFFPERRPFFLENSDFFSTPLELVFTRRIADPQFGARLTGKAGPYAIGALVMDDQSPGRRASGNDPMRDQRALFTIARVRRDILKQSNVGVIFTNRQFGDSYNRVGGVDGRIKLNQNWVSGFQAVTSATRTPDGKYLAGPAYQAYLYRSGRQFNYQLNYEDYRPNFRTETGFVRRTDVRNIEQEINYNFRPQGKYLISWGPRVFTDHKWDHQGTRLDDTVGVNMRWEFTGQTYAGFFALRNRERLRPKDFPILKENRDFASNIKGFFINSGYLRWLSFNSEYSRWAGINFVPPSGQEPFHTDRSEANIGATVRPSNRLRVDNTYLFSRSLDRFGLTGKKGANIFQNHIIRSKWNWQLNRELSLRVILQYEALLANPSLTALETRKNFNADFLITYQLNPWTALYAGYNSNLQNLDLVTTPQGTRIARYPDRFINDGKQLFVKLSYLFRF